MRAWSLVAVMLSFGIAACEQRPPQPVVEQPAQNTAGQSAAAGGTDCTLDVGWDPWEPYQYEDAAGEVRGLDVDIVRRLADEAGCSVSFVRGNWRELLAGVRSGEVDILMAATPTDERREYAWFSPPYRTETFALYTRADTADELAPKSLQQLAQTGRRIGIAEGYYYGEKVTGLILGEDTRQAFVSAPLVELNYTRLVDGEVDALLDDPFVAAAVTRRKGWSERIARHPLEIHSGDVSLMYSKAGLDPQVVQRLDAALAASKLSGSLDQLLDRYRG